MSDDIVTRLRDIEGGYGFRAICREAADEIERLRKQRDEARRAVCCSALPSDFTEWKPKIVDATLRLISAQRGWDCYEDKP